MKQVQFKEVTLAEVEVMQDELMTYIYGFAEHLKNKGEHAVFMYSVTQVDIAQRLILFFRGKIESKKEKYSFGLPLAQAVVLHNACSNAQVLSSKEFVKHVAGTYSDDIDHQLKSLVITN